MSVLTVDVLLFLRNWLCTAIQYCSRSVYGLCVFLGGGVCLRFFHGLAVIAAVAEKVLKLKVCQ
jgi:hypothetical protein